MSAPVPTLADELRERCFNSHAEHDKSANWRVPSGHTCLDLRAAAALEEKDKALHDIGYGLIGDTPANVILHRFAETARAALRAGEVKP